MNAHATHRRPGAFTLTELIVVLTVIVIMIAVAIPAFRSIMAGTESSNAETQLRLAFLTGRDAALHSDNRADSAVVFFYEPGGRTSMLACEYVGTFTDSTGIAPTDRDVFVPLSNFEPIQLPRGWMVRGLVPANTMEIGGGGRDWYEDSGANQRPMDPGERNWVFPETGFYDALASDDGNDRQSFMVRFSGLTGAVAVGDSREALVLDPRPTASQRPSDQDHRVFRFEQGGDLAGKVRRALSSTQFTMDEISQFLGNEAGDTVLCRTVEQVVLYKEAELAAALQVRLDPETGSVYMARNAPTYVAELRDPNQMRQWLEGDTNLSGPPGETELDEEDLPLARLYTLQRYTGVLQPVPLLNLQDLLGSGAAGGQP